MEHLWSYVCRVLDEIIKCNLPLPLKRTVLRLKAELSIETWFLKTVSITVRSLISTEMMIAGLLFSVCFHLL